MCCTVAAGARGAAAPPRSARWSPPACWPRCCSWPTPRLWGTPPLGPSGGSQGVEGGFPAQHCKACRLGVHPSRRRCPSPGCRPPRPAPAAAPTSSRWVAACTACAGSATGRLIRWSSMCMRTQVGGQQMGDGVGRDAAAHLVTPFPLPPSHPFCCSHAALLSLHSGRPLFGSTVLVVLVLQADPEHAANLR